MGEDGEKKHLFPPPPNSKHEKQRKGQKQQSLRTAHQSRQPLLIVKTRALRVQRARATGDLWRRERPLSHCLRQASDGLWVVPRAAPSRLIGRIHQYVRISSDSILSDVRIKAAGSERAIPPRETLSYQRKDQMSLLNCCAKKIK